MLTFFALCLGSAPVMLAFRSSGPNCGRLASERKSKSEQQQQATTMPNVNKCSRQLALPCLVYSHSPHARSLVTFCSSLSLSRSRSRSRLTRSTWRWRRLRLLLLLLRVVVSRPTLPFYAVRLFKCSAKPPFVCMRVESLVRSSNASLSRVNFCCCRFS